MISTTSEYRKEEKQIRKVLKLMVWLLTLGATLSLVSAALATPPKEATGETAPVSPPEVIETRVADGNLILTMRVDIEFTGDIEGLCENEERVVIYLNGVITAQALLECPDLTVIGQTGDAVLRLFATGDVQTGAFRGQLVVLSGTGDLANLRGRGVIQGQAGVRATYSVLVHVDP